MAATTITFHVDDAERGELVARAEREKISLSEYVRVRLGLRGQGAEGNGEVEDDRQYDGLRKQILDHDRRLHALEDRLAGGAG